ncbi:fumarylacetoacetate hydrolase family protein [Oceanobacter mangrovi]|uniref:fumarylacetoacetate hydrolase family protein n=1 Tax=Oceanobacter mangrovi TaxID=2862510 RepID=UPI001C8DF779|nr:fumarylacetoacetate hydrolase family protein [Oceanobacter mangrovi]
MKLATLKDGSRDGRLMLVNRQLTAMTEAGAAATMQQLIENWDELAPQLEARNSALNNSEWAGAEAFDPARLMAPLPRAYQFVDASSFLNHGKIMEQAYNLSVKKTPGIPILVQRQGDDFVNAVDDYAFPTEADQCDFEGEIAVILDDVPAGVTLENAESHIKLFTLINDVSMRGHLFRELQMGFGLINAKPATTFAPVACTLDELGDSFANGRVNLDMVVHRNHQWFGNPNGREMDFSFAELISHWAYNRNLGAGTVLGTGTFSNAGYREVGSACLAERRAVEVIDTGESTTPFIQYGDSLQFEMFASDRSSLFGKIDQTFVAGNGTGPRTKPVAANSRNGEVC